jgi:hypothetical protein
LTSQNFKARSESIALDHARAIKLRRSGDPSWRKASEQILLSIRNLYQDVKKDFSASEQAYLTSILVTLTPESITAQPFRGLEFLGRLNPGRAQSRPQALGEWATPETTAKVDKSKTTPLWQWGLIGLTGVMALSVALKSVRSSGG